MAASGSPAGACPSPSWKESDPRRDRVALGRVPLETDVLEAELAGAGVRPGGGQLRACGGAAGAGVKAPGRGRQGSLTMI